MASYRFKGRATGSDPTGYYYPRWDKARKISVVAETKKQASEKACRMLGDHPRFGTSTHYGWAIIWDSIEEEPTACQHNTESEAP